MHISNMSKLHACIFLICRNCLHAFFFSTLNVLELNTSTGISVTVTVTVAVTVTVTVTAYYPTVFLSQRHFQRETIRSEYEKKMHFWPKKASKMLSIVPN